MRVILLIVLSWTFLGVHAQNSSTPKPTLYHPEENATVAIEQAVKKAAAEKKNVLIQAGGNWCGWCIEFNRFVLNDAKIDSLLKEDFVVYHLNYSKENKNESIFSNYKFPQRFDFPVLLILNEKGELIHTQKSSYLEEGKSYSKEKVVDFLQNWNRKALSADTYTNQ